MAAVTFTFCPVGGSYSTAHLAGYEGPTVWLLRQHCDDDSDVLLAVFRDRPDDAQLLPHVAAYLSGVPEGAYPPDWFMVDEVPLAAAPSDRWQRVEQSIRDYLEEDRQSFVSDLLNEGGEWDAPARLTAIVREQLGG